MQWLVESQLDTSSFAWSVGQVEFTTHNYDRRAVPDYNDHFTVSERRRYPILRTVDLFWNYWVEATEEDLLETRPRSIKSSFWWGVKRRRTLWKTKRTRADKVRLLRNFIDETTPTHSHNSVRCLQHCTNPHYAAFKRQHSVQSVCIQVMPFLQPQVQITHRHNFDCHPDIGLLLSRVRLVVCWDCHVTSFAWSACVVCECHSF